MAPDFRAYRLMDLGIWVEGALLQTLNTSIPVFGSCHNSNSNSCSLWQEQQEEEGEEGATCSVRALTQDSPCLVVTRTQDLRARTLSLSKRFMIAQHMQLWALALACNACCINECLCHSTSGLRYSLCACTCVCRCTDICVSVEKPEVHVLCLPVSLSILYFGTGSLTKMGLTDSARLGGKQAIQDPPVSIPLGLRL